MIFCWAKPLALPANGTAGSIFISYKSAEQDLLRSPSNQMFKRAVRFPVQPKICGKARGREKQECVINREGHRWLQVEKSK